MIDRMTNHLNDYNNNFKNVVQAKERRNKVLKGLISNAFENELPKKVVDSSLQKSDDDDVETLKIKSLMKSSKISLLQFLISPNHEYVESFNALISSALKFSEQKTFPKETKSNI